MRYMLMIKGGAPNPKALREYNQALIDAKVWLCAEALGDACTVQRTRGKSEQIEGAFSNIAAYWQIRVQSREEALKWAERAPVERGHVELRTLYETEDFPVDPAEEEGGWREKEVAFRDAPPPAPASKQPRFILLLQGHALTETGALPPQEVLEQMGALMGELANNGQLLGGDGLKPSASGIRMYFEGKQRRVVDGPFSETKELVAGYTMLCVPTRDEAIDFAKRWLQIHAQLLPGDAPTAIEIRRLSE
jgi:hypothetical protein